MSNNSWKKFLTLLALLILLNALAGCGQKGPLYLPEKEKQSEKKSD